MKKRKPAVANSFFNFYKFNLNISREVIVEIISGLFFLLFLYAASSKLLEYERFKAQIGVSPILNPIASLAAFLVPLTELVLAVLLMVPKTRLPALYGSFTLMLMFTLYIVVILNFSEHIPCSCGGIFEKMRWREHLIFNIFFTALAVAAIFLQSTHQSKKVVNEPL